MTAPIPPPADLDELPDISQKLKLTCVACGKRRAYEVGRVFFHEEGEGTSLKYQYTFSRYFRCRDCDSAGPWEVTDPFTLSSLILRAGLGRSAPVLHGRIRLFDGTFMQTTAMGEDYLLGLLAKEPQSAFLHTRLGNLMRRGGERVKAIEWYGKALVLDAGELEALYNLLQFGLDDADFLAVIHHLPSLVHHLRKGRKASTEELTSGIAFKVVEILRTVPEEVQAEFLNPAQTGITAADRKFMQNLWSQQGDEELILTAAMNRLLNGGVDPPESAETKDHKPLESDNGLPPPDLVPSLRDLVIAAGLEATQLSVAAALDDEGELLVERNEVLVCDKKSTANWSVSSIREMFRGNHPGPADMDYPTEYAMQFAFIESHLLTACDVLGDRTDQEMVEIYSALRRRPDGRSLGLLHDFLWQVCALVVGMHPLSQAEFEAILGRLERSARTWSERPVSRNYLNTVRSQFETVDR